MKIIFILLMVLYISYSYSNNKTISSISSDTICGNKSAIHPIFSGTGHWVSSSTNVKFISTNSSISTIPNDSVFSSVYNSDQGMPSFYEIYWYYDENSNIDTFRLTFARVPTGIITFRKPYCNGKTAELYSENDSLAKPKYFIWNFDNGEIDSVKNNTITSYAFDSIYYISWNTLNGNIHHVSLISITSYGCNSASNTAEIIEPIAIQPFDSLYPTTCMQANGIIWLINVDSIHSSYMWLDPQFASNPYALKQYNLMAGIPYHVRFSYDSWSPNIYCIDTIVEILNNVGNVTADFNYYVNGQTVCFQNTSIGNTHYFNWSFGDFLESTLEAPCHTYYSGNSFQVCLIVRSIEGCRDTICRSISLSDISLNEKLNFKIEILPNPISEKSIIKYNLSKRYYVKIDIVNIYGKNICRILNQYQNPGEYEFILPKKLDNGIYLIQITVDDQIFYKKIIVE